MNELALYIDIEGFAVNFENGAKQSFINLTNDLFVLGQSELDHLSFIQFGGDGFLIKEILTYTNDLDKFVDLSTALLQSVCLRGGMGRVQISSGYMSDISGLYSTEIRQKIEENNTNILDQHNNIMIINNVIGTSIINCYKLKGPKGPLLLIDKDLVPEQEKPKYIHYKSKDYDVYGVNWLKRKNNTIDSILNLLNLDSKELIDRTQNYLNNNGLPDEWKEETIKLIHLTCPKRNG